MLVGLHSQQATDEEIQTKVKQLKVKFPITTGGGGPHQVNIATVTTQSNAPIAQLDRALGYELRGREFESL